MDFFSDWAGQPGAVDVDAVVPSRVGVWFVANAYALALAVGKKLLVRCSLLA
jgi:hypothetical protein